MIRTIAFKEFYSNLISARFIIGFLICLFLIPFTMIVSINDYQNQVTGYEIAREKAEKVYDARVYSALRPEIVSPPEPLSIFSRGISYNVGNSVKILLGEIPMLASAPGETYNNPFSGEISDNPFLKSFFSIDFISIITIIMSLIALIFTYDACSHEREIGTLKLALSNPISRSYLILGKAVGVILTLLPIIVFCYVLSSIIILISPHITLSQGEWFRVALLFMMSILYFMVFMFLGLFISSSFKSSATSIVVCLIAWIVFVFIIPNLSSYVSQSLIQVDTEENLRRSLSDLNSEFNEKYPWPGQMTFVGGNIGSDGYSEVTGSSPETMERTLAYYRNSEPARIGYADKKWAFQKAYFDKLDRQRAFAEKISLLSPSEIFQLMSTALCRTDVQSYEHFLNMVRRYRELFIAFFKDKNIFASYLYFTRQDPGTFMTTDEMVRNMSGGVYETWNAFSKWANNHNWDFTPLSKVALPIKSFHEYPPLDFSDVPRFQWEPVSIGNDLKKILVKGTALISICIVLFSLSFISFIHYDVR